MPSYQNPFFNSNYIPATYSNLSASVALSGWDPLDNPDFSAYLCQTLKNATNPNSDPLVRLENSNEFDYENYLSSFYQQLSTLGDTRVNFYETWTEITNTILPRATTQIEIAQAGGCQVIEGFICNAEGIALKKASTNCKEGEAFLKPITQTEIVTTVTNFIDKKHNLHSDAYAKFIVKNYINKGYSVNLIFYSKMYMFYTEAIKNKGTPDETREYIKYYQDSKNYVSKKLNIPLTQIDDFIFRVEDSQKGRENADKLIKHLIIDPLPDYTKLV
jgi:hypothetical protein